MGYAFFAAVIILIIASAYELCASAYELSRGDSTMIERNTENEIGLCGVELLPDVRGVTVTRGSTVYAKWRIGTYLSGGSGWADPMRVAPDALDALIVDEVQPGGTLLVRYGADSPRVYISKGEYVTER